MIILISLVILISYWLIVQPRTSHSRRNICLCQCRFLTLSGWTYYLQPRKINNIPVITSVTCYSSDNLYLKQFTVHLLKGQFPPE